jgi:murein DD-endopeptidase MepM/ murein hydrolase activator NlpD
VVLRLWKLWIALLAIGLTFGLFAVWRQRQPGPTVALEPAFAALGHSRRTVALRLGAPAGTLAAVKVEVVQAGTSRPVLEEDLSAASARESERPLALDAPALGLKEGPAELVVFARDSLWRPRPDPAPRLVHRFTVDLTPPTVEVRAATQYVKHAGAGLVVYRVTGAARSGVRVGTAMFPGVAGLAPDPAVHVALYGIPYDGPATAPTVVAEDEAGNQRTLGVAVTFLPTRFPKDTIRLSTPFLQRKVPELAPQTAGDASPAQLLEAFLTVNREGRQAAEAKIREVTRAGSDPRPLWQGAFRQQANTKVFANFPEERTYLVDERVVDTQWHLGIDLASNRQSPVAAANAGRVVFTGLNGIYGNTVIVDHGLGLFSLYGHLSEIAVQVGQAVSQGQPLGRSGETGFAGGDHLHFATLVHGTYVTPLEWWDPHWIRDRIAKPLTEASISLPGISDGALGPADPAPPPAPARRAGAGSRAKRP